MTGMARLVKTGLVGFALVILAGGVRAAAPAPSADFAAGVELAAHGNGSNIPACAVCHGARGQGLSAMAAPRLAGLDAAYLARQIASFADGGRANPTMAPIAKALTKDQIQDITRYYASLPPPPPLLSGLAPTRLPQAPGAKLAERGNWPHDVPACAACHGLDGRGAGPSFPPLVGQNSAYLAAELRAFKSGARHNDPQALMRGIAARLTSEEIIAVSNYYGAASPAGAASTAGAAGTAGPALAPPAAGMANTAGITGIGGRVAVRGVADRASAPNVAPAQAARARKTVAFTPPPESAIPNNAFGRLVREGEAIFRHTGLYARRYVDNHLSCANCHLDAGRLANSAPLWAAYVAYPAYRKKNHRVNSYAERLQGCFRFSMNGSPPPQGSKVLQALESYSYFLARGAPTGVSLPGRGYPKLPPPPKPADFARGAALYQQKCALCHGVDGAGRIANGRTVFPPLWGAYSYNWGAGMASINTAADFIKANMPLSQADSLSNQQAFNIAAFIDSHERPQDPRFAGSIRETRARFHNSAMSMYGRNVDGRLLGQGITVPKPKP